MALYSSNPVPETRHKTRAPAPESLYSAQIFPSPFQRARFLSSSRHTSLPRSQHKHITKPSTRSNLQIHSVYLLKSHNDTALFVETDPETGTGSTHRILHDGTISAGLRHERTVEKRGTTTEIRKVGVTSAASYPVSWEVVMSKLVGELSRSGGGLLGPGDAGGWKGRANRSRHGWAVE
ncbi:hypothetical protein N7512_006247 [Penicillium capsulatum]|nr:hypothetical protein N7512_006247 [Penicillium capsulatum]